VKTPSSIFRPSLAWLLLLIVCSQHLAGRLYVGRVYSVEIAARMTPNEHAVATMLKAKTGIDIQVTLLGENQPHHISRTGYTAPVVISEEIDGTTYFYAIGHKPEKTAYFTYPANTQQAAKGIPGEASLLVQLFSDYCFDTPGFLITPPPVTRHTATFLSQLAMPGGEPAVPHPPPRRV
jgi:hypothetical protein